MARKSKQKFLSKKWLLITGVFVAMLVILLGLYQQRQLGSGLPQADTGGWKTYSKPGYGFSFQYPSHFKIMYDRLPKELPENGNSKEILIFGSDQTKSQFQIHANLPGTSGPCSPDLIYNATKSIDKPLKFSQTKGGENFDENCIDESYLARIDLLEEGELYVSFSNTDETTSSQAEFEQILSTFKFTQ